jgi:hypothetical protein
LTHFQNKNTSWQFKASYVSDYMTKNIAWLEIYSGFNYLQKLFIPVDQTDKNRQVMKKKLQP